MKKYGRFLIWVRERVEERMPPEDQPISMAAAIFYALLLAFVVVAATLVAMEFLGTFLSLLCLAALFGAYILGQRAIKQIRAEQPLIS